MPRIKKKEKNKNLHLGFYFAFVVIFIIVISATFKVFDTISRSEYDGDNFFTIAIVLDDKTDIISFSPKEGALKVLKFKERAGESELKEIGIPYDSLAEGKGEMGEDPKSIFAKLLLSQNKLDSELTFIDKIRLFTYASTIDGNGIHEEDFTYNDLNGVDRPLSDWFADPVILEEKKNIEVINKTEVSGLGNKFAKIITNMGGNVVLVRSSQDETRDSVIYYAEESYTVKKISKLLNISMEKKELNSISDIIINIGRDRQDF